MSDTVDRDMPLWRRLAIAIGHRVRQLTTAAMATLLFLSFLTMFARHWWVADLCANLRMQWAIGLCPVIILQLFQRRWAVVALPAVTLVFHSLFMTSGLAVQESPANGETLRLTTANVLSSNRRHDEILAELRRSDADIVTIIELSSDLQKYLEPTLQESHPFVRLVPNDRGNFGIGLYSRVPFQNAIVHYLNDDGNPSIVATFRIAGRDLSIVATHPSPPMGPAGFARRNDQLKALSQFVRKTKTAQPERSVIVMGDLNVTPWSPLFTDLLADANLVSAAQGHGYTPTWYRRDSFPFGLILDHVLTSPDLSCREYRVGVNVGSDHRFVTTSVTIPDTSP